MSTTAGLDARCKLAEIGVFLLGAASLALPQGLAGFALCLFLSTFLGWRQLQAGAAEMGRPLRVLLWLSAAVVAMALLSNLLFEDHLRDVDNRSRFIALPWIALWTYSLKPRMGALWLGALVGIAVSLLLALWQVEHQLPRAYGWTNSIVFADVLLALVVVVALCRPHGRWPWLVVALVAAIAAIVLSGSRGVWFGLALVLALLVWGAGWRSHRQRGMALLGALVVLVVLLLSVPGLDRQMRLLELRTDMQRLEHGDVESSAGARLEVWRVAFDTARKHPFTGVGIGRFEDALAADPDCRADPELDYCRLGHAHNDLAEWTAAQGIPGGLLLLMVYGVPLWLLLHLHRASGRERWRGPAAAGVTVVVCYAMCGFTQSMFAHQLSGGMYVSLLGVLVGMAAREAQQAAAASAAATELSGN